jgi:hypothetical protein
VLVQHLVLESRQSLLEDGRIGCFSCLLHFSPVCEGEKPVCHVDNVEEFMRYKRDKDFPSLL